MWINKYTTTLFSIVVAFIATGVYSKEISQLFGTSELKEGDKQVGTDDSISKHMQARSIFKFGNRRRIYPFFSKKIAYGGIEPRKTSHSAVNSKTIAHSDVNVNILVKSGKITMKRFVRKKGTKMIMIEFGSLQEIDANGGVINSPEHKMTSFANQTFQFSKPRNGYYQDTGIRCKIITFQSKIQNGAEVKIHMFLFKEGGKITIDKETTIVKAGDLKFNVELTDWPFCTPASKCPNDVVGKYLDFDMVMKGSKKATEKRCKNAPIYNLGSGTVILSKMMEIDGTMVEMVVGYPMLDNQVCKDKFVFRFPEFDYKVLYDPLITIPAVFETVTETVVVQPDENEFLC